MDITMMKHAFGKSPRTYRGHVEVVLPKDYPSLDTLVATGCKKSANPDNSVTLQIKFYTREQLVAACNKFFRVGGVGIDHQKITICSTGDKANAQRMLDKNYAGRFDPRPIHI